MPAADGFAITSPIDRFRYDGVVPSRSSFLALCAFLLLSGCNSHRAAKEGIQDSSSRKPAPEFALKDVDGRTVRLADYKGKVVLLNFWATNCGPCKIEIPWFTDFERKYKDRGFAVLGVSLDEEGWDVVKPYLAKSAVNYRVVLGSDDVVNSYGGIDAIPTTFMLDREGRIAATHVGLISKGAYESEIANLLGSV